MEPELDKAELLERLLQLMGGAIANKNLEYLRILAGRLVSLMRDWDGWREL